MSTSYFIINNKIFFLIIYLSVIDHQICKIIKIINFLSISN